MTDDERFLRTGIGDATADAITIRGRDLATELMGRVTFTELAFLLVSGRRPSEGETRMLDAVLVSLADHGLTPTVLAARLTHTGAPESLQGAVAAGLLGAGSVFLGVVEDTARFLGTVLEATGPDPTDDEIAAALREAIAARRERGERVPGLGHPIHKQQDPRTPRMYAIARETGQLGPHLRALRLLETVHREISGRALPINGAGVGGAALADLGFPADLVRGFALIARSAGLVAHIGEELEQPIGMRLAGEVDRRARYEPPAATA
jgi:citrate synthase